jgi:transposase
MAEGDPILKGTKYDWLRNPKGRSWSEARAFTLLREIVTKVARTWSLREAAMELWELHSQGAADRNFKRWFHWARCSRLEPVRRVAEMLQRHWANIRTFFQHRITNAGAESINEKIQTVKRRARGFRNRQRFRNAIFFHCGELDLYPATLRAAS